MKKFKSLYYLLEQDEKLPEIYEKMKAWTDELKGLSNDEKTKLAQDPNGYGKEFWEKMTNLFGNINSSIPNSDAVLGDEKEVIENFKSELIKFEVIYDELFKPTFDKIIPVATAASSSTGEEASTWEDPTALDLTKGEEAAPTGEGPATEEPTPTATTSSFSDESVIDYLDSKGEPSDFGSRSKLASENGIENYRGTREQNLDLLAKLKSGKTSTTKDASTSTPTKSGGTPKIKFNGSMVDVYVDAGGGRYVPANEDQLGDPNTQLYVKNPKRGQTEYLKPTYVKVRREGNELRRQSQFGGALGSLSNLFGDIGNTLTK